MNHLTCWSVCLCVCVCVMKGPLGICGGSDSWADRGRSDQPRREGPFITVIKEPWEWRSRDCKCILTCIKSKSPNLVDMIVCGEWINSKKIGTKDGNQTKHKVTRFPLFIFSPPPPYNTLSLPLPLSPTRSAWLILMGRPLFVNVPSCVHRCGLSIIAGLWGSFSIWRHIWHSAASINVVIILIFMS